MNPEIEALAAYILENKAELDYYSNKEMFGLRNDPVSGQTQVFKKK